MRCCSRVVFCDAVGTLGGWVRKVPLYREKSTQLVAGGGREMGRGVPGGAAGVWATPTRQSAGRVAAGHLHRVHRRCLRRWSHGSYTGGQVAGGGQGMRAGRDSRPLLLGDAVRAVARAGSSPRGDGAARAGRAPAGIRVHRTRSLHPEDVVRHRGIPTSLGRTDDHGPRGDAEDVPLRRLMSRAQSMHLTNLRLLGRQLDRAAGRPGRARFARVLATRPPRHPHGAGRPRL